MFYLFLLFSHSRRSNCCKILFLLNPYLIHYIENSEIWDTRLCACKLLKSQNQLDTKSEKWKRKSQKQIPKTPTSAFILLRWVSLEYTSYCFRLWTAMVAAKLFPFPYLFKFCNVGSCLRHFVKIWQLLASKETIFLFFNLYARV